MHVYFPLPSPVEPGDILIRPKKSGFGYHYGTGLSNGLVKDNTPERGHHVTDLQGFQDGLPVWIYRPFRTPEQSALVEQRALSNIGEPYLYADANCEHDANFSQLGIASSPTVNALIGLGLVGGMLALIPNARR